MQTKPDQGERLRSRPAGQLISADLLARKLDLSKRTLQRLQAKGMVPPPIKLGGSVRWRLEVVEEWIENGCPAQNASD